MCFYLATAVKIRDSPVTELVLIFQLQQLLYFSCLIPVLEVQVTYKVRPIMIDSFSVSLQGKQYASFATSGNSTSFAFANGTNRTKP